MSEYRAWIRRAMAQRHAPIQPITIKGDFDHAYWLAPNRKDRIIFDQEGNILRGADLEDYYWKLRKNIGRHPLFGYRFASVNNSVDKLLGKTLEKK